MSKLFIIESATNERIPFLRGMLVESLARSGLSFQDAYLVAQTIRSSLENKTEISTDILKQRVSTIVRDSFGESLALMSLDHPGNDKL